MAIAYRNITGVVSLHRRTTTHRRRRVVAHRHIWKKQHFFNDSATIFNNFRKFCGDFWQFCGYFATILKRFGIIHWLYNDSTKIIRRFYNDYTTITMITTILQRFCIKTWTKQRFFNEFAPLMRWLMMIINIRWGNS